MPSSRKPALCTQARRLGELRVGVTCWCPGRSPGRSASLEMGGLRLVNARSVSVLAAAKTELTAAEQGSLPKHDDLQPVGAADFRAGCRAPFRTSLERKALLGALLSLVGPPFARSAQGWARPPRRALCAAPFGASSPMGRHDSLLRKQLRNLPASESSAGHRKAGKMLLLYPLNVKA